MKWLIAVFKYDLYCYVQLKESHSLIKRHEKAIKSLNCCLADHIEKNIQKSLSQTNNGHDKKHSSYFK